jgi:hypothetical protein
MCVGALVVVILASRLSGGLRHPGAERIDLRPVKAAAPRKRPGRKSGAEALPGRAQLGPARAFASRRLGLVSFAVVDTSGDLRCHRCRRRNLSGGLLNAMLLAAHLERFGAERRLPVAADRALVEPMTRVHDDHATDSIYARVGDAGHYRRGRWAGMRDFGMWGYWANAQAPVADQVHLFARLRRLVPLSSLLRSQSRGTRQVARRRWRTYLKGGWWEASSGQLVHQAALLGRRGRSMAVAVLSDGSPSRDYATATVRGIAERLLGGRPAAARPEEPVRPTGRLVVVGGSSEIPGRGSLKRFAVEVEEGLAVSPRAFAAFVEATLSSRRGWGREFAFKRVSRGPVSFRVTLASPPTTDRLCAPLETNGLFSCYMRGQAVLNFRRWRERALWPSRRAHRRYMVNHEVGHAIGHGHTSCGGAGRPAPVMMQQSKGVSPCRASSWPLPEERR